MLHLLLWNDKYFTRRQSVWLRCFCWNNWMWILFFWASIQIHSPASREALMNNYFTLSNHLSALAVYRPRELAWLCCLLVYEQHFCLEVSTAVCFFFPFLSQESEVVRMMMLLLHPLELKQPSPILQQSSVLLRVNLSKLCSRIKIYIHCFASGIYHCCVIPHAYELVSPPI